MQQACWHTKYHITCNKLMNNCYCRLAWCMGPHQAPVLDLSLTSILILSVAKNAISCANVCQSQLVVAGYSNSFACAMWFLRPSRELFLVIKITICKLFCSIQRIYPYDNLKIEINKVPKFVFKSPIAVAASAEKSLGMRLWTELFKL